VRFFRFIFVTEMSTQRFSLFFSDRQSVSFKAYFVIQLGMKLTEAKTTV